MYWNLDESKMKFPSNSNGTGRIISETGPGTPVGQTKQDDNYQTPLLAWTAR